MNQARLIAPILLLVSGTTFGQQPPVTQYPFQQAQQPVQQAVQPVPVQQVPVQQVNYVQATVPPQPKSGLGKEVAAQKRPVTIVMPKPTEVVEDAIDDIEESQLTEKQIERLKRLSLRRERMKATPYVDPAKPITRTHIVNLDPGVSPPILRVTKGQLTSVVFSDMNGEPWIIKDVSLNREMFSDGREGAAGGAQTEPTNVLTLEPKMTASYGNVTIKLKGLSTPVIFILAAAQQEVDMRVDSKVPGKNPDAAETVSYTNIPSMDVSLTSFLDGVPPKEARRLNVSGLPNTEAWLHQDNLYVRTDAQAQYPAYYSSARSTSGKAVYRFDSRQNSVTLLSNGRAVTVFIED